MSKTLPKFHIATNPNEIAAHGPHADGIAKTSFGSHQIRVTPYGSILDDELNFSNRFLSNGMPDPRLTSMGGYVRKF